MSNQSTNSSRSGGGVDRDDKTEATRLKSVSISQRFEWTGLPNTGQSNDTVGANTGATSPARKKQKIEGEFINATLEERCSGDILTDLPLWHIIGYALDESSCWTLSLICKEWTNCVSRIAPPGVLRMAAILNQCDGRYDRVIRIPNALKLLRTSFDSLKTSSSPLYRAKGDESKGDEWPYLQPQFSLILIRFVCKLCTQSSPFNGSQDVYRTTSEFLKSLAQNISDEVWDVMVACLQQDDVTELINNLLHAWKHWKGISQTISEIAGYLDRYYVVHHTLSTISQVGRESLVDALAGRLNKEEAVQGRGRGEGAPILPPPVKILQSIICHASSLLESKYLSQNEQVDLLHFSRVCEDLFSDLEPNNTTRPVIDAYHTRIVPHIGALEESTAQERFGVSDKSVASTNASSFVERNTLDQICIIAMPENTPFQFSPRSNLCLSSGLLRKLHLLGGEIIKLNVTSSVMAKATEFYIMQDEGPMPPITKPLRSNILSELVGPRYAAFVDRIDLATLCRLIEFANLMDLKALLELTCFKTALIQTRETGMV